MAVQLCEKCGEPQRLGEAACRKCGTEYPKGYYTMGIYAYIAAWLMAVFFVLASALFPSSAVVAKLMFIVSLLALVDIFVSIYSIKECAAFKYKGKALCVMALVISICCVFVGLVGSLLVSNRASRKPSVTKRDGFDIQSRSKQGGEEVQVQAWYWNGQLNNTRIKIPDAHSACYYSNTEKYEYYMSEFKVKLEDENKDYFQSSAFKKSKYGSDQYFITADFEKNLEGFGVSPDTKVEFQDIVFTIILDDEICSVDIQAYDTPSQYRRYLGVMNDDGSITFYHVFYRFECPDENEKYYAEDGKLYGKASGELAFPGAYKAD